MNLVGQEIWVDCGDDGHDMTRIGTILESVVSEDSDSIVLTVTYDEDDPADAAWHQLKLAVELAKREGDVRAIALMYRNNATFRYAVDAMRSFVATGGIINV